MRLSHRARWRTSHGTCRDAIKAFSLWTWTRNRSPTPRCAQLRKKYSLTIIALSGENVHPKLEESLRHHIYACLGKPADSDELLYMLKSVFT